MVMNWSRVDSAKKWNFDGGLTLVGIGLAAERTSDAMALALTSMAVLTQQMWVRFSVAGLRALMKQPPKNPQQRPVTTGALNLKIHSSSLPSIWNILWNMCENFHIYGQ